jgi:hypothetical protein
VWCVTAVLHDASRFKDSAHPYNISFIPIPQSVLGHCVGSWEYSYGCALELVSPLGVDDDDEGSASCTLHSAAVES